MKKIDLINGHERERKKMLKKKEIRLMKGIKKKKCFTLNSELRWKPSSLKRKKGNRRKEEKRETGFISRPAKTTQGQHLFH